MLLCFLENKLVYTIYHNHICVCLGRGVVAEYQLIEQKKDWCEARLYCRKHFTDLVSINNNTQNEEALRRGANRTFWIGLKHDNYQWEDGQCSTFRDIGAYRGDKKCSTIGGEQYMILDQCCNSFAIICMQGELQHFKSCGNLTC